MKIEQLHYGRLPLLIAQASMSDRRDLWRRPMAAPFRSQGRVLGIDCRASEGRGIMAKPVLSKEELRAQLEVALANYHGPVTHCPPAPVARA
jgi:hypothetical protein